MNWFRKLPGFVRSPAGFERVLWRRLPSMLAWGTVLPLLVGVILLYTPVGVLLCGNGHGPQILFYEIIGFLVVYWITIGTIGIGCILVMIMKGPAYIADEFPKETVKDPKRSRH